MYGERIDNAKQALILFLRSLPFGCKFTVISYGSRQEFLSIRGVTGNIFEYTEENLTEAIRQIETFDADMGGTNIASPMDMAINEVSDPALTKRVILLTDGQITEGEPAERVIELAAAENAITHTIGLSRGADADLLERTAEAGRGSFSLIDD